MEKESHNHHHDNATNIGIAFLLNLVFTVFEIVGGLWTNSMAILSDALHDLGDSLTLGLSWFLERYSKKEKDRQYSYGYQRYSLLAAMLNTIVLIVGSIIILSEVIPRLFHPTAPKAEGMLLLAVVGIVVNGFAALRLRNGNSLNQKSITWHLMEDVLGWIVVLIVSIILMFRDWYILDPLMSIGITIYIMTHVVENFKQTMAIFLQAVPDKTSAREIEKRLLAIPNVLSIHHTHFWSLDGEHHVLTTHAVVLENTSHEEVARIKSAVKSIADEFGCEHITLEIEYCGDDCTMDGSQ
ncbi:MAG: cation diffusion facilitator family transporter [Candidatus Marinimicrobia bacterium]|nr:cation diffusion facilitator family transporter [Candidatus Neomarinimicrobiota bacterium]